MLATDQHLVALPILRRVQRCLSAFHLLLQAQDFLACPTFWPLATIGCLPSPMMCRARVESEVETAFRESLEQNCYHERARRDNLLRWGRKEQAKNLPTPRQVLFHCGIVYAPCQPFCLLIHTCWPLTCPSCWRSCQMLSDTFGVMPRHIFAY